MLEHDRIDISEGIDINKTSASKKGDIYHYCYFVSKIFNYEPYLWNGCHDLMQIAMNFNDVAVASVGRSDYRIRLWYISKDDTISLMNNSDLSEKRGLL